METLFGMNPEDIQAQRTAQARQQAMQFAQMSPAERATMGFYQAGNQLGGALAGMMGAKDPQLERAATINKLVQNTDMNDLESVKGLVGQLNKVGATREAMSLLPRIDALTKTQEDRQYRKEDKEAALEARKAEIEMRGQQRLTEIQAQAAAALERAREANASREQIAQIMADARRQAAQVAADTRLQMAQFAASLKAEKPEKVDDKLGTAISVLEQQSPLIQVAQDIKARIEENPGYLTISGKLGGMLDAATGTDTPALTLQSDLKAFQNKARNAYLLLAKGTQTEGDAERAWKEFSTELDWSTPQGAKRSVSRIEEELTRQVNATKAYVNARSPGRIPTTPEPVNPKPATTKDGWSIRPKQP